MSIRLCLFSISLVAAFHLVPAHGQIYRWDNGDLIPGTAGIRPGPGVRLPLNLEFSALQLADLTNVDLSRSKLNNAKLSGANLSSANLAVSELSNADLSGANLNNADVSRSNLSNSNLTGANLYNAALKHSNLENAIFSGADISNADLGGAIGFTKEQLYSTASYQAHNLQGVGLSGIDHTDWNFSGQNLTDSRLAGTLRGANFIGATVIAVDFQSSTWRGFTKEQLYSTSSYQAKDLRGIGLTRNDLTGWNFSGQNLTDANLGTSVLTNINLIGALVRGTNFTKQRISDVTGLVKEQLYSTASYREKDLKGIGLGRYDLSGWDFSGQDLTDAHFSSSTLTNTKLTNAIVRGSHFSATTDSRGFTREQLYSTLSYQAKDLRGIWLDKNNLREWDFSDQNLNNSVLSRSRLTNADFRGASIKNAWFDFRFSNDPILFDSTTVYNQWTVFPDRFDPGEHGLTFVHSPTGDFNADDVLDSRDIDWLSRWMRSMRSEVPWLQNVIFDLNADSVVNEDDRRIWIRELKNTWFGDANLDGKVDSRDMVDVFNAAEYEDGIPRNSSWSEGDWNGDGDFTSGDLSLAFTDGGFELGPRPRLYLVPEPPNALLLVGSAIFGVIQFRRNST